MQIWPKIAKIDKLYREEQTAKSNYAAPKHSKNSKFKTPTRHTKIRQFYNSEKTCLDESPDTTRRLSFYLQILVDAVKLIINFSPSISFLESNQY